MPSPSIPALRCLGLAALAVLVADGSALADSAKQVFGKTEQSEAALMGVLYDLKQTQDHVPTEIDPNDYADILDNFFAHGWDERLLDHYYRVSRPLYTTQIFIPLFSADEAPKEFGVERTVQPSRWIVHYKGQVSAPEAGTYRLAGYADDVIVAAINSKLVLNGSRPDTHFPRMNWRPSETRGQEAANGRLTYGDWFDVKENEIVDIDVIIGERPGGYFGAFLMVQEKGATYSTDAQGFPILPIFQVAAYNTPLSDEAPLFAQGFPPWKSYQ